MLTPERADLAAEEILSGYRNARAQQRPWFIFDRFTELRGLPAAQQARLIHAAQQSVNRHPVMLGTVAALLLAVLAIAFSEPDVHNHDSLLPSLSFSSAAIVLSLRRLLMKRYFRKAMPNGRRL